jgi:hypothetical protein
MTFPRETARREVGRRAERRWPWLLPVAGAFLASLLFTLRGATIFLPGDSRVYLLNASRMLQGQVIYKDFFQFMPPGTELVYSALLRWFGPRAWIPNLTLWLLALGAVWLSIIISRKVMSGWAVFLPGLLLITVSIYHGLDPSHQWFSLLAVIGAAASLIEKRTMRRVAIAGSLCGLASFFTLPRGLLAYAGFAVFLLWDYRRSPQRRSQLLRREGLLAASFLATVLVTNGYFAWRVGLRLFLESTVAFAIRYYPEDTLSNTFKTYLSTPPALHPWYGLTWVAAYLLIHVLVPGVYVLFAIRYGRQAAREPQQHWDRLVLVEVVGVALFLSVALAPSYFRLCVVSPPALILFAWFLELPGRVERALGRLLWAFVFLMAVVDVQQMQRHASRAIDLPSGPTAFEQPAYNEEFAWLRDRTRPPEFFFEASWANTYVALGLRNPTPVPFVSPTGYTPPAQVQAVIAALEARRVKFVLWSLDLDTRRTGADPLRPLRAELRGHYEVIKTFSNGDQMWRRNE